VVRDPVQDRDTDPTVVRVRQRDLDRRGVDPLGRLRLRTLLGGLYHVLPELPHEAETGDQDEGGGNPPAIPAEGVRERRHERERGQGDHDDGRDREDSALSAGALPASPHRPSLPTHRRAGFGWQRRGAATRPGCDRRDESTADDGLTETSSAGDLTGDEFREVCLRQSQHFDTVLLELRDHIRRRQ